MSYPARVSCSAVFLQVSKFLDTINTLAPFTTNPYILSEFMYGIREERNKKINY